MRKYKALSILGLIFAFTPNFMIYIDTQLSIYRIFFSSLWVTATIFGIISTGVFLNNPKLIKLQWFIPAMFSVVLNLSFLFVNSQI